MIPHRVGRRGCALLFFALLDFFYCHALLFPSSTARRSGAYQFLALVLPLWAWAILWGVVGAICAICAFRRHDQPGFAAAMGLKVLWGTVYLGGWLFVGLERGYVAAVIWLAFAALVGLLSTWPEPPRGGEAWTRPSP
jgi:hypothetical protein